MYRMTNRRPKPVLTYAVQTLTEESSALVAANIRAVMGRDQVKPGELATRLEKPRPWLHRRMYARQRLTIHDIAAIAWALGVSPDELTGPQT